MGGPSEKLTDSAPMAVLLALAASAIFGVADFLGGMSARRILPVLTAAASQISGLLVLAIAAAVVGGELIAVDLWTGAAAGAIGAVALTTFYFALSRGPMSVVAPVSAVSAAIVPVIIGVFIGESPGPIQWAGIAVAFPAIVLISREGTLEGDPDSGVPLEETTTPADNRVGLTAGLLAGVGFGLFVSIITRTSSTSGVWPAVTARSTASILLVALVLAMRIPVKGGSISGWRLAGWAGILDGSSNLLILSAGRRGMLALVGVIGALYPASTIVLARVVLGEKLQRHQLAGLGLAVVAVLMIALP